MSTTSVLRRQALRQPLKSLAYPMRIGHRTFLSARSSKPSAARPAERLDIQRLAQQSADYHRTRQLFLLCGAITGTISFVVLAWKLKQELAKNPSKLDSSLPPTDPLAGNDATARKIVLHDAEGREIVPTGNSTVKDFPRTINLPSATPQTLRDKPATPTTASGISATNEYTLVGLGLRTVSFLGIQVYVVGYYVETSDIAALQSALVKRVNPIATTLVPGERDELRVALLDPVQSNEIWQELLQSGVPARSAFRVVPVRDTDFHHLRDGFVRAIQARTPPTSQVDDEQFGEAMRAFRTLFNRGKVSRREELLLVRDGQGRLSILCEGGDNKKQGGSGGRQLLGTVDDERISRALWLNYLGGKNVASEPARKSIVEGVMELVERPVGTVATRVI